MKPVLVTCSTIRPKVEMHRLTVATGLPMTLSPGLEHAGTKWPSRRLDTYLSPIPKQQALPHVPAISLL